MYLKVEHIIVLTRMNHTNIFIMQISSDLYLKMNELIL